jgi:regulatory protein
VRLSDRRRQVDEHAATDIKRLRVAALRALTRKEHGTAELQRKLEQKGYARALVQTVLATLTEEGLLSDARYAQAFIRQHAGRGHGPGRIRAELRSRGVADDVMAIAIEAAEVDWAELAAGVRRKRFGRATPRTPLERAKQGRFLQYRGFDSDHVRAAFQSAARSLDDGGDEAREFDGLESEPCPGRDEEFE